VIPDFPLIPRGVLSSRGPRTRGIGMANILFTWEFGGGSGHVTPYVELIRRLGQQGHRVFFALRYMDRAQKLEGTGATCLQAPLMPPVDKQDRPPSADSFPAILALMGYRDAGAIRRCCEAWLELYREVDPALIIFDFSPTAMLAARVFPARRMAIGTGFHLPPEHEPLPDLRWHLGKRHRRSDLLAFEHGILAAVNEALAQLGAEPLRRLADIFQADVKLLRSYPELDHYPGRGKAEYAGVLRAPPGARPDWPGAGGPRIFAYLKKFPALPTLFNYLNILKLPTLVYGDKLPLRAAWELGSDTLKFCDRAIDMSHVGRHADLAINNGGHGTVAELLAQGVPSLVLPLNLEQQLVGANVQRLGAGLSVPSLEREAMRRALDRLLATDRYRSKTRAIAKQLSQRHLDDPLAVFLGHIAELIGNP